LNAQTTGNAVYTIAGNPNLTPETADTTGIGVVFQPRFIDGFTMSVDYWEVNIQGALFPLTAQQVMDSCYNKIVVALCANILRGPDGQITRVNSYPINLSQLDTQGIDLEASYRKPLSELVTGLRGDMTLHGNMTFYLKSLQDNPFVPSLDAVGQNIMDGIPKWKLNATATYQLDPITVSVNGRAFSSGTINNNYIACTSGCPTSTVAHPTINMNYMPGAFYMDADIRYALDIGDSRTADLFLSVKNIFNEDGPPVTQSQRANLYDLTGSIYRIGMRFKM
jgi:outer membrane receptor protein involved in Fe transport